MRGVHGLLLVMLQLLCCGYMGKYLQFKQWRLSVGWKFVPVWFVCLNRPKLRFLLCESLSVKLIFDAWRLKNTWIQLSAMQNEQVSIIAFSLLIGFVCTFSRFSSCSTGSNVPDKVLFFHCKSQPQADLNCEI